MYLNKLVSVESGIAGPFASEQNHSGKQKPKIKKKAGNNTSNKGENEKEKKTMEKGKNENDVKKCKFCGLVGHVRRSYRSCLQNKKNLIVQTGKLLLYRVSIVFTFQTNELNI